MKQTILKNKTYFGYFFYGILLTVFFLYYCFPADAFRDYIQASASRIHPRLIVSVVDVRPSFPFGLKLLQATLSRKTSPDTRLFAADSFMIRPEIWSFLRGKSKYYLHCRAYEGEVAGHVHFLEDGLQPPFAASITLKDIGIEHYAFLSALIGRNAKGALEGTISYSGQDNSLIRGIGEANLRISDGSLHLSKPFLYIDSFDFSQLRAKLVLKNQKIDLSHVKLEGREIQGTLSGAISLRKEFMKSRLNLKGTIDLLPAFFLKGDKGAGDREMLSEQPLETPFTISGTIAEPEFKFI